MTEIFLSHAVADKHFAELVVDLLVDAIGVPPTSIFCSSLPGFGVPLTHNFNEDMRQKIQNPKLVLLLMTPTYMQSMFGMMELGAAWAGKLRPLPIVVPPATFQDVTSTLGLAHGWEITNSDMLQGVRTLVREALGISGHSDHIFDRKRQKWSLDLQEAMGRLSPAPFVPRHELDMLRRENDAFRAEISRKEEENRKLEKKLGSVSWLRPVALVVESEHKASENLRRILDEQGFVVGGTAQTKNEATQKAAALRPDILAMETVLGDGSSGIEAANEIMAMPNVDAYPVFVTSWPEKLLTDKRPEPAYLVTKPYSDEALAEKLQMAYADLKLRRGSI